jgi:hypothetical protein
MIEVGVEEMHGSDRVSEPEIDYERAWVGGAQFINESEMALFPECKESCAQKIVDTADIVRDAIFRRHLSLWSIFGLAKTVPSGGNLLFRNAS